MPNQLKDGQSINMYIGLNCAKQVACYADFSAQTSELNLLCDIM